MKKIVTILLIYYAIILNSQVFQGGNSINPITFPASPNASNLGTYGQIPVNLFNGQPTINIELYKIKVDTYEMPISLSYNLASVKPDEHPGWVGLGWNLNAGGAITRLINGRADEILVPNFKNKALFSYYDNYQTLDRNNWMSDENMWNYYDGLRTMGPSYFLAPPSPDEFMFNVNGISGSFFKNHKGKWVVKANQNIDIQITDELFYNFKIKEEAYRFANLLNIERIIYGFTLVTSDGTKYVFGKNPKAIEFFSNGSSSQDEYYATLIAKTWYLTQIVLPNSQTITFEYETGSQLKGGHVANKAVYSQYISSVFLNYNTSGSISGGTANESEGKGYSKSYSLVRQFFTYLNKIKFNENVIEFNRSLSNDLNFDLKDKSKWLAYKGYTHHYPVDYNSDKHWFKLDNFIVKNNFGQSQVLRIDFNYIEKPDSRLFLKNINQSGTDPKITKTHSFQYDSTPLPAYEAQKTDYWGYYNNLNFFESVKPIHGHAYSKAQLRDIYPNYRKPNPSVMQAGILKHITYPTGGYSDFIYEPHEVSQIIDKNSKGINLIKAGNEKEIIGGLRIKKIISQSVDGNGWEKEYLYVKDYKNGNYTSSGILSGKPYCFDEGKATKFSYWKLTGSPIIALSNTNGSPVTYTKVIEKDKNGGFTEYIYTNQDNGYKDLPNNRIFIAFQNTSSGNFDLNDMPKQLPFNSLEIERGKLLSEKIYDNKKNLLQEINYEYNTSSSRFADEIRILHYIEDVYGNVQGDGPFSIIQHITSLFKMSAYSIFTHHTYLKQKETTVYDLKNNLSIKTLQKYSYANSPGFHQLKTQSSSTSTGELITQYQYPPDLAASDPLMQELTAQNRIAAPVSTEVRRLENGTEKQLSFSRIEYAKDATTSQLILPKFVYSKKGEASAEKKITYDRYDSHGNLLQYTPQEGLPVTIIWGYSQTYPIAKIEGATYSQIENQVENLQKLSDDANSSGLWEAFARLRAQLPDARITSYTYQPLVGVTSITAPNSLTEYYSYDSMGRLMQIKDSEGNLLKSFEYNYKSQN